MEAAQRSGERLAQRSVPASSAAAQLVGDQAVDVGEAQIVVDDPARCGGRASRPTRSRWRPGARSRSRKLAVMRIVSAKSSPSLFPKQYLTIATFASARPHTSLTENGRPLAFVQQLVRGREQALGGGVRAARGLGGAGQWWGDRRVHGATYIRKTGLRRSRSGAFAHTDSARPEHVARVGRLDDAVVPQPGAGVVGVALRLVLVADLLLARLDRLRVRLAADHRQHRRGLLAAHDRDARVGPHPEEAREVRAARTCRSCRRRTSRRRSR